MFRFSQLRAVGYDGEQKHSRGQSGKMEGGPRMGGGKSVGSLGSGGLCAVGLGTEGFLEVGGRLVGLLGRGLWVTTASIRRNRANAERSPVPAFMVLQLSMKGRLLMFTLL